MSEHNIIVEGGTSVRLPTAGKYVARDIIITAEGGKEDLDAVLTEQEELIEELNAVLDNKVQNTAVIEPLEITENGVYSPPIGIDGYAPVSVNVESGGGSLGELTKYAKVIAKPASTTSFVIENPLGGIAKKVSVIKKPFAPTSKRRCGKFLADYDLGIGVGLYHDTDSSVLYTSTLTSGTINNGTFKITEGQISIYRFNAANTWDTTCEYEIEIYQ